MDFWRIGIRLQLLLWENKRGRACLLGMAALCLFGVFLLFRPFFGVVEEAHKARLFAQAEIVAGLVAETALEEDAGEGEILSWDGVQKNLTERRNFNPEITAALFRDLRDVVKAQLLLYDSEGKGLVDSDEPLRAQRVQARSLPPPGQTSQAQDPSLAKKTRLQRAAAWRVLEGKRSARRVWLEEDAFYIVGAPVKRLRIIRGAVLLVSPAQPEGEGRLVLMAFAAALMVAIFVGAAALYGFVFPWERESAGTAMPRWGERR